MKQKFSERESYEEVNIRLTAHNPKQFEEILEIDNITLEDLLDIFNIDENRKNIFKAGQASGASGSFFFFT